MKQAIVNKEVMSFPEEVLVCVGRPGINIQPAPGYIEINGMTTLACCDSLPKDKARHILTGSLFEHLFRIMFPTDENDVPLPRSKQELDDCSDDVRHVTGLIIQLFESLIERGEKVFLKNPETHMHPAQQRRFISMLNAINALAVGEDSEGETPTA